MNNIEQFIGGILINLVNIAQKDLRDDDFGYIGDLSSYDAYDVGTEQGQIILARKLLTDLNIKWD